MVTGVVTALAALTRFVNLGSPTDAGTPIFDEKHYAPQAWQMLHNHGVEDNPGYGLVVHPPVGKQLIAIGEALFGYNGLGWRFTGALLGVIMVALVVRIVRRISRSTLVGAIAGLLLIADGVSFVVGAHRAARRLSDLLRGRGVRRADRRPRSGSRAHARRTARGPHRPTRCGVRGWACGGGASAPACCSDWPVGQSGPACTSWLFFGVMSLAFDVAARRQYRVPRPWLGTLRRDLFPTAYALLAHSVRGVPGQLCAMVRLRDGDRPPRGRPDHRHEVDFPLPDAIRSLWHYTDKAYHFHAGLTNAAGNYHPWESKPWTWPMSLRPVLYAIDQQNVPGCGAQSCVKAVMLVGTPAMWWLSVPVLFYACWRMLVRRDWRYAAVLVGYCAGWLPWFADIDRQMYFFYAATMAPFLAMAIALILGDILYKPGQGAERRSLGLILVSCYVAMVLTNFAWLFPILTGQPISQNTWNMEIWLPSWR